MNTLTFEHKFLKGYEILFFQIPQYCTKHLEMAAAVLPSMQGLSLDREIMPPSPVSQNSSRHGRSRHGGSVAKGKARGRGYSIVDDREVMVTKALTWALKRTVDEEDEQEEGNERLVADSEGWVDCEDLVSATNSPKSYLLISTNS